MPVYKSAQEFEDILTALWTRIFASPEIMQGLEGEKLIVKFQFSDFQQELFIDSTGDKPELRWNPGEHAPFDVEMILASDTSHKFWMQDLNVPLAIGTRKIVAKGSVQKALKLIPALKPAFALYPEILKEFGRNDLLQKTAAGTRKRSWLARVFSSRRRSDAYDLSLVPSFSIPLTDGKPDATQERIAQTADPQPSDMDLLTAMLRIREFETYLSQAFKAGEIPSEAIHLSIGQEAVAAGVCLNLKDTDYLNTTHRGHGHIIAKGADLKGMMAELYGKANGLCRGLGGSMHVTERKKGVLGANGIVGAGYLLALGAGFSIKNTPTSDAISVVIAGDGSVNQGMFHEAMNMISVFELPVLVVVENNLYGEFTSVERHSGEPELFKRAHAYRIESDRVDGNDVRRVSAKVREIVHKMRKDRKPRLLELMTYRWHGHMEGDPESYRNKDEVSKHKELDPIVSLEKTLLAEGLVQQKDLDAIKSAAAQEIKEAVQYAVDSPSPEQSALTEHIYAPEDKRLFSGSFDLGNREVREMSVSQAINLAIAEEMERDKKVFLWGEDVSLGGYFNVTSGLIEKFGPSRIIDTPISENGIVGGAVGAAITGSRPVCEILFADFLTCCMDPILNQAAKIRFMTGGQVSAPLTIRTPVGSGIGMAAQHSQSMERFFFGIPGLIVLAVSDAFTAKGLMKSAIRSDNPVLVFEHKLLYAESGNVPVDDYTLPIGKARIVLAGDDVTIVTYSLGVGIAIKASELLAQKGIRAEIIDLATLYPMDTETILKSVRKTGHLVVVEEALFSGSVGSEIISRVALAGFGLLKKAPAKICAADCPIPYAKNLEVSMLPAPEKVVETVEALLG
ncbi:MAG: dehydrogenase E1 component subunit alpha/beta [Thermodesulfobacteriota bacterium]